MKRPPCSSFFLRLLPLLLIGSLLSMHTQIIYSAEADSTITVSESNSDDFEDWGDDWAEDSPWSNKLNLSLGSGQLNDDRSNLNNSVYRELRMNYEFDYSNADHKLSGEIEYLYDKIIDESELELYQLYYHYSGIANTDIKIGRQVITWGTGDLVFLNDLFSKSWLSFFNGRNDKYLKPPVDAIRISHYGEKLNWELAYMPEFVPDYTPTGERYSFYIPGVGIEQPFEPISKKEPDESELALRIFGSVDGVEWAGYGYSGYFKSPSKFTQNFELTYAKMDALGASVRLNAFGGIIHSELSYYQSKEDKRGDQPLINNDQLRYLIGYESELRSNLTLASQFYVEKTMDIEALQTNALPGQIVPDEYRTMFTFRLTDLSLQQKLMNSIMLFYSPSDNDYYLRASSSYRLNDNWQLIGGLNWFDGKEDSTFLAQFQYNSNLYIRVEYSI